MIDSSQEYRLFRAFGFPVFANMGAGLLLVLMVLFQADSGVLGVVFGLSLGLGILLSVLAHELGHAFAVRKLGYGASTILLSMFGGLCRWRGRARPMDRVAISLAGPAVSLLLGLVMTFTWHFIPVPLVAFLVKQLGFLNLVWCVFNMLPVYPMDGGQALRGVLTTRVPEWKAAEISLIVSAAVGVAVATLALVYGYYVAGIMLGMMVAQNVQEWQALNGRR
jgi:Zn-dependent protease